MLKEQGFSAAKAEKLLLQTNYMPVFTAHPTEAKRRIMQEALRRIFILLQSTDDRSLSQVERDEASDRLLAEIQLLWKTDEVRPGKPTVQTEVKNGLHYFEKSLFEAIPILYRNLQRAWRQTYPDSPRTLPSFIQFGSWIGGDRDGNPHVTARVTRGSLPDAGTCHPRRIHPPRPRPGKHPQPFLPSDQTGPNACAPAWKPTARCWTGCGTEPVHYSRQSRTVASWK